MGSTKERPGYWAVIPAAVRYDKDLPPNAKLLYGEVTALLDKRGYCYAQNSYFAELFGLSDRSVSRLLAALVERGYLRIDVIRDQSTQEVLERRIYAVYTARVEEQPPPDNFVGTPPDKNNATPPDKNGGEINTRSDHRSPLPPKGGRRTKQELDGAVKSLLVEYAAGDAELAQALDDLMEVREAKKAVNTARAVATLLGQLDRLGGGSRERKLQIVRQSVTNSWKSVFPIKGGQAPPREEEPYVVE